MGFTVIRNCFYLEGEVGGEMRRKAEGHLDVERAHPQAISTPAGFPKVTAKKPLLTRLLLPSPPLQICICYLGGRGLCPWGKQLLINYYTYHHSSFCYNVFNINRWHQLFCFFPWCSATILKQSEHTHVASIACSDGLSWLSSESGKQNYTWKEIDPKTRRIYWPMSAAGWGCLQQKSSSLDGLAYMFF